MFSSVVRRSVALSWVLSSSARFLKVMKRRSGVAFSWFLISFQRFLKVVELLLTF